MLLLLAVAALVVPVAVWFYLYPLQERRIPYRNLPGPKPSNFIFGSLLDVQNSPIATRYSGLTDRWGTTLRIRGLFGSWRIVSTDITAISYVLRHTGLFHRHPSFNYLILRICGPGVLMVEDEPHRRQRRILNSAFNGTSVNNMMPMMWEEAYVLKNHVEKQVAKSSQVDMLQAYIGTALDVIGRAGFNYRFDSHQENYQNPLAAAFNNMINTGLENKLVAFTSQVFPAALDWPTKNKRAQLASRKIVDKIGNEIIRERKEEIKRDHISLEKGDYDGKDVISLCLRANMLANERDKISHDEVLGQIGALVSTQKSSCMLTSDACW